MIASNIFKLALNPKLNFTGIKDEEERQKKAIAAANSLEIPNDGQNFHSNGCDQLDIKLYIDVTEPTDEDE